MISIFEICRNGSGFADFPRTRFKIALVSNMITQHRSLFNKKRLIDLYEGFNGRFTGNFRINFHLHHSANSFFPLSFWQQNAVLNNL